MKVYIDGENLRHRLVSVLLHTGRIHDSDDMFKANIRQIITDALRDATGEAPDEILYYTTRIRQPEYEIPEKLHNKIAQIQESHRRWIAELTNQGIRIVKAGLLKVRESSACVHCGKRTLLLQEKGVDVRMASEMVVAAVHDDAKTIVVLSSDADMIPALEIVRRAGTRVIYLCFEDEVNNAMRLATDQTVTYTRRNILDAFSNYRKDSQDRRSDSQREANYG
jgi:uncharacterized LabA/DUF88 family protein